jgi:hypothetical protein
VISIAAGAICDTDLKTSPGSSEPRHRVLTAQLEACYRSSHAGTSSLPASQDAIPCPRLALTTFVRKELALPDSHTVAYLVAGAAITAEAAAQVPHEASGRPFLRAFGCPYRGGCAAQLTMIQHEHVTAGWSASTSGCARIGGIRQRRARVDGCIEAKFKALSGRSDQAAGARWRWKDGNNYVARANAPEGNVSLCYANWRRNIIKCVDAPVAKAVGHTLRVEFRGASIKVARRTCMRLGIPASPEAGRSACGRRPPALQHSTILHTVPSARRSRPRSSTGERSPCTK